MKGGEQNINMSEGDSFSRASMSVEAVVRHGQDFEVRRSPRGYEVRRLGGKRGEGSLQVEFFP